MSVAMVANVVRLAAMLVAFVIAIGIALIALEAKDEGLVGGWLDICRFLTDPFQGAVELEGRRERLETAINWGIAAAVYVIAAFLVTALLARVSSRI